MVTFSIETAAAFLGFIEHAIAARIWRAIGDAMQHDVNIDTWAKCFLETFAASAVNYVFNRKIGSLGVFAVKESRSDPNLIGDFDLGENGSQVPVNKTLRPSFRSHQFSLNLIYRLSR